MKNMEPWIIGVTASAGALAFSAWSLVIAYNKSMETKIIEFWSPLRTAITVIPVLCAAFIAGYAMPAESIVTIFVAGFGIASAQSKTGVNSFFVEKLK
jgi:hypothetical protein